jgi:redox-sensitive bicupin YhaK (pirin superfamily)
MNTSQINTVKIREIVQLTRGIAASDGDGVQLTRIIGSPPVEMIDPFLLLDAFGSDRPGDYIGGFPDHPHRGFETVTYLLAGRMRHKDNAGHEGVIQPGGVQWMTAGSGIVHSEMPEQEDGLLSGFQLWVNLPASEKMSKPAYQEFPASEIPVEAHDDGAQINVIAGQTDRGTKGPVRNPHTEPLYLDVHLKQSTRFQQTVPDTHGGFIYVIKGTIEVSGTQVPASSLAVLSDGDRVEITSPNGKSRFLLIAGRRLNEPVARGGPFVMNTREEVLQAFDDYRHGRF